MIQRRIERQEQCTLQAGSHINAQALLKEFERILDGRLHARVNAPRVVQYVRLSGHSHAGDYLGLLTLARGR